MQGIMCHPRIIERMVAGILTTLFCLQGIIGFVSCDELYHLADAIFVDYDSGIRPHCGPDGITNVTIDVKLRQILFMNEPTQEIKIKVWMTLKWVDCRLTWNKTESEYDSLHLPKDRIWIPDISLFDSTSDEALPGMDDYRAKISRNGSITYRWPTVITSYCKLNVRKFPMDSQVCEFVFISWIHNGGDIDLHSPYSNGSADMTNYQENAEWEVTMFNSTRTVTFYNCCKKPFIDMRYYLHIKRRHLNYIFTLVFPCLLISFLPLLGFLLPVSYGEKVSLQVTMMLSLVVFLMVIATSLPPSSDAMPLLSIYFVCSLSLVAVSCIITVGVINIHFKTKKSVPNWVKTFVIGKLGSLVLVDSIFDDEDERTGNQYVTMDEIEPSKYHRHGSRKRDIDSHQVSGVSAEIAKVITQLDGIERRFQAKDIEAKRANEWRILAIVIDRVCFVLCSVFLIVALIAAFPN